MNILYIHTHDTGRFIQPYGYMVDTPNLMKLANEGTTFRHAHCACPTCSPSRAAMLTGTMPHTNGMIGLSHRGFAINDYDMHLVRLLNNNGYETVLCGVQHEAKDEKQIGYQKILATNVSDTDAVKAACEYLKQNKHKPFFMSFGMFGTHRPYPKSDINPDYVMPPSIFPDTEEVRKDFSEFMESVSCADICIGNVLLALESAGIAEDTLVIYTTDHGVAFPNMKCNLYDTGTGVSLIMKYPENKQKGKALDCLVSHIDVFPTICDIIGIEKPRYLQGKSLLPILKGEENEVNAEIFSEITFHAAYEPMRMVRTKRYKLIRYYEKPEVICANIDDGYTKRFLLANGYKDIVREDELLFDLYTDPVERVNHIGNISYKEVYEDLSNRLRNWMIKTNDPLLEGRVEMPVGARINKRSCLSPMEKEYEG